jgi:adenylate kinase family enzyme
VTAALTGGVPSTLHVRRRILVVGSGGAGKSTFASALGELTGMPVVHLDRYFWSAGWQPMPTDSWSRLVTQLTSAPRWIMDGNYGGSLSLRIPRCDAVVFFDFPRSVCLWGVVKRRLRFAKESRPDMAAGCNEQLSLEFLSWIWRYRVNSRPRVLAEIAKARADVEVIRVASRRAVRELLARTRCALTLARGRRSGAGVL